MSPFPISEHGATDWLLLVMVGASFWFAVFMSQRAGGFDRAAFVPFLYEGITLAAAVVLLISVFYKPWFGAVTDNKVIVIIVAVMTMSNGIRDIAANFHRTRSTLGEHDGER